MIFDYQPKNSFPALSWIFAIPILGALAAAVYFSLQYWVGPEYDVGCNCGNVMYHDPVNFVFALMMLCFAGIGFLQFAIWHGTQA